MLIDYDHSLVSFSNSLLQAYGAAPHHSTLPELDSLLALGRKHTIVLLLDGMGLSVLEQHLPRDGFLRRHLRGTFSSVFPPTTTAATTSLDSGLTPAEHGWLGWSLYFRQIDRIVDIFINKDSYTRDSAAAYPVTGRYLPYTTIEEQITRAGGRMHTLRPLGNRKASAFTRLLDQILKLSQEDERSLIYAYWENPDALLHAKGYESGKVSAVLRVLEKQIEHLAGKLDDCLLVVTADHGHIPVVYDFFSDHPALQGMLERPISIEPRAAACYVKADALSAFPEAFNSAFGDAYVLYSREELLRNGLFGPGEPHELFSSFLGDYVAVAVKNRALLYSRDRTQLASHHAGYTRQELEIPLIAVDCRKAAIKRR